LKELFNGTTLLNTNLSSVVYFVSIEKNPFLTNWNLSNGFASFICVGSANPCNISIEFGFICSKKCFPSFSGASSSINGSYNLNSQGIAVFASTQCIVDFTLRPVNPEPLLVSGS